MPLTIKQHDLPVSPHAQAAIKVAGEVVTEQHKITTELDPIPGDPHHEKLIEHVAGTVTEIDPPTLEEIGDIISVGMGFKMPVAPYVMVEYRVERSKVSDKGKEDDTFNEVKDWVETRVNELVQAQQDAMPIVEPQPAPEQQTNQKQA